MLHADVSRWKIPTVCPHLKPHSLWNHAQDYLYHIYSLNPFLLILLPLPLVYFTRYAHILTTFLSGIICLLALKSLMYNFQRKANRVLSSTAWGWPRVYFHFWWSACLCLGYPTGGGSSAPALMLGWCQADSPETGWGWTSPCCLVFTTWAAI